MLPFLYMENLKAKLFMVATPIGNMGDMTYRGVETLKSVDLIACEDTRVTKKLLMHYGIDTQTVSLNQHASPEKIQHLISQLQSGKSIAYVTDAGTPGISDPGNQLVAACVEEGVDVVAVPGASAISAIISIAGVDMQKFLFMAYPPHKKGRHTFFEKLASSENPVIYYDSVHRVLKNLDLLEEKKPGAQVILGRELTKMFEQVARGTAGEVREHFIENPSQVKGEFVIIVI